MMVLLLDVLLSLLVFVVIVAALCCHGVIDVLLACVLCLFDIVVDAVLVVAWLVVVML